ncbi:hypothetical protein BAC3_01351 [uncultured bacterium]|nr:hypothetical protein BAC3_01351 [uncultured bacterium]
MQSVSEAKFQCNPATQNVALVDIAKFAYPPATASAENTLIKFYLQTLSSSLLPDERVSKCLRQIRPGQSQVEVRVNPEHTSAHYANLITCARLWFCPVCASRISEKRAEELTIASYIWRQSGGFVSMFTFTLSHNVKQTLHSVLNTLREAHRKFKSGSPFKKIQSRYGWAGSVCALEVTHGLNGWHCHLHELVFLTPLSDDAYRNLERDAKKRWIDSLAAVQGSATYEHGLDIQVGDDKVSEYIAKYGKLPEHPSWSVEREIAKSVTKLGKHEGRTPFQILMDYGEGSASDKSLFLEYAFEFKGRKQLVWSRGLRDMLKMGIEENDAQIAEKLPIEYKTLAVLPKMAWKRLIALPSDERGHILTIARTGNKAALDSYLNSLGIIP